jgi:hypothetical protein
VAVRRALIAVGATVLWLLLAVLWVAWAVAVCLLVQRRRPRRKLIPDFPNLIRMAGWRSRRPRPVQVRRMSSAEKSRRLAQLAARDGLYCQECDLELDLDIHHLEDAHPEVHHLVAWSECRSEWWADQLVNLCLLCGPCNRSIGAGSTWRLDELAAGLRAQAA